VGLVPPRRNLTDQSDVGPSDRSMGDVNLNGQGASHACAGFSPTRMDDPVSWCLRGHDETAALMPSMTHSKASSAITITATQRPRRWQERAPWCR